MAKRGYEIKDAFLLRTAALPATDSSTATDGIDLELGGSSEFTAQHECLLSVPDLTGAELPDEETMTYNIEHADESDFSDAEVLFEGIIVQTGENDGEMEPADTGAPGSSVRVKLPTTVKRYVRAVAEASDDNDASGKNMTFNLLI